MAVHDAAMAGDDVPAGLAMAVALAASVAGDADRTAVTLVAMVDAAAELGNVMAANVGMTAANLHDQVVAGRLNGRSNERRRAGSGHECEGGGQAGRRYDA